MRVAQNVDFDENLGGTFKDIITLPGDTIFLDSIFRKLDQFNYVKCYGFLPDTDNLVHLIWLAPVASSYAPCLVTFTKQGEEISEDWLGVGGCGPDPCFHCSETIVLKKDYTFYAADTNFYEPCDDYNRPIAGKPRITVNYKTGILSHTGKPQFSDLKEIEVQAGSTDTMPDSKEMAFQRFLKNFIVITPPVNLADNGSINGKGYEDFPDFLSDPGNALFMDTKFMERSMYKEAKCFIVLSDTENCYHVIWLAPASIYYPVLTTYSKTGDIISSNDLTAGECGGDECLEDCKDTESISKDYTTYSAIIMTYREPCDSLYMQHKPTITTMYKTGKITHSGNPVFSKLLTKIVHK